MTPADRVPPQDLAAEQSVIGGMLLSKDVIGDVIPIVRPDDFYRPAHGSLFEVIVELHERGEPADAVIVAAELHRRGVLQRLGGAPYLHTLLQSVPTAANAAYYAEIVAEKATLRRLVAAGTRIVQLGYGEVDRDRIGDVCDRAREALEGATGSPTAAVDQSSSLAELIAEPELPQNWVVPNLLECGDRLILSGFEGTGKACDVRHSILTPKGWTTIGALAVGDEVFSPDGAPTRIIAATEVMHDRPCYRVRFSDGAEIIADGSHLWRTETLPCREAEARFARRGPDRPRGADQRHKRVHHPSVVTTEQIRDTLHFRPGVINHAIPTCEPLQFPRQEQPVDPYVLGAWLGDGDTVHANITSDDPEILDHLRAAGEFVRPKPQRYRYTLAAGPNDVQFRPPLSARLRTIGVLGDKHIPDRYLYAAVDQRIALLQGIMDTDGTIDAGGDGHGRGSGAAICEITLCHERLARDVHTLLLGLGLKVRWRESPATLHGRVTGTRYRLLFQTDLPVFRLPRKAARLTPLRTRRAKLRYIVAVDPVPSVPVKCVQVDRSDGMFVVGRECIPTHNSILVAQLALTIAGGIHPFTGDPLAGLDGGTRRVLVLDVENTRSQLKRRLSQMAVVIDHVRRGHGLDPVDWHDAVRTIIRPDGVDLAKPAEVARLEASCSAMAPDLLLAGPLYKLTGWNTHEEEGALKLLQTLDRIRVRHNLALIAEHHAGHAQAGQARSTRPIGSSVFLRWPEFGLGIVRHPDGNPDEEHPSWVQVRRWRGSREEREWPKELRHGGRGRLPWAPVEE